MLSRYINNHAARTPSNTSDLVTIHHLPYDLLLEIFTTLPVIDIVNFLSSCRALWLYIREESIWKHLASYYGLNDVTCFNGRSYYTIYTELLYPYGPLLGLWANDHPFTGAILEFRLDTHCNNDQNGIVAEVWTFRSLEPEELSEDSYKSEHPERIRVLTIGFRNKPPSLTEHDTTTISCAFPSTIEGNPDVQAVTASAHSVKLRTRLGTYAHPEFPNKGVPWLDKSRRIPRLKQSVQDILDQTSFISYKRPRVPVIYTAPGPLKPPALTVRCCDLCTQLHCPFLGFEKAISEVPRYYPIRVDVRDGILPMSRQWDPASLEGLWLGSYGPHGTEVLWFQWDNASRVLSAHKLTGDENVPRGAITWTCTMDSTYDVPTERRVKFCQLFGDLHSCKLYSGVCVGSDRGYLFKEELPFVLGVTGPDEVMLNFLDISEMSECIRYKGRGGF